MHLVSGVAVVVTRDGGVLITDELFVQEKLVEDAFLHLFADPLWGSAVVREVELIGVVFEHLEKYKEAGAVNAQDTEHLL
jgi:hypothetical protein